MKLSIAVAALIAASLVGYYVNAEPRDPRVYQIQSTPSAVDPAPVAPYVPHPIAPPPHSGPVYAQPVPTVLPAPIAGPVYPQPYRSAGPLETSVVEVAREYGKTLESAVHEQIITGEQASQLVSELVVFLAVKKARVDLLRVTKTLDAIELDGNCGPVWDEVRELRKLLPSREAIELKGELSAKRERRDHVGEVQLDESTKQ